MDNLAAARSQMGMSLGFHIVFAVIGVALPLMMRAPTSRIQRKISRQQQVGPISSRRKSSQAMPDPEPYEWFY